MRKHQFRFLAEKSAENRWHIVGEELIHLRRVLRLSKGDRIEVGNGRGIWASGIISEIDTERAIVEEMEVFLEDRPAARIHLFIGAMRPGAFDDFLPDLVEIGVDGISVFSQPQTPKSQTSEKVIGRWNKIIREAVKQSKRAWAPSLKTFRSLEEAIKEELTEEDTVRLELDCEAEKSIVHYLTSRELKNKKIFLAIGSEKGFDPIETETLSCNRFEKASIGTYILRAKTAVVVGAAISLLIASNSPN